MGRLAAPAGWFMNAWNLDAPADVAAPDMVGVWWLVRTAEGKESVEDEDGAARSQARWRDLLRSEC